jgi:predicted nucleotidyltransferase
MAERDDHMNEKVRDFLEKVQTKYNVTRAYLYGSFAKGTSNKWSDIDLAIVSPDFADDPSEDRLVLMRLATTIDDRIEPTPFKEESFNRNDPLVDEIQKNGIQLL